ncbi:uncharacterized protein LOC132627220 [Lycium barbarum]|uniref:uncharacterized protein LOC132627220 n=1 Tax=Lycium barbarum TaxID=112863 RepID=UPI00293E360F|nr:uncharacterized protein LOC132627220 [Lycium barbarum]
MVQTSLLMKRKLGKFLEFPLTAKIVKNISASVEFLNIIAKQEGTISGEQLYKKQLKPEYQLLFELVKKVLLPHDERRSMAAIPDLYLIEALANFTPVSLPALMIEHMKKVVTVKEGRHGLAYGFFLTKVFEHFEIKVGKVIVGTRKQMFTLGTLEDCECVPKKGGFGRSSTISSLIDAQERATEETNKLRVENAILKTELQQCAKEREEPGASGLLKEDNAQLQAVVEKLKAEVE